MTSDLKKEHENATSFTYESSGTKDKSQHFLSQLNSDGKESFLDKENSF